MKVCARCKHVNEISATFCCHCRHKEFLMVALPQPVPRPPKPGPEFLVAEREGTVTVLKCRTPGEAALVAEELEAADILVTVPDEEAMEQELIEHGYITLRVSAQSYQADEELQRIVDRKHWEDRAQAPLPWPMSLAGLGLGLFFVPGIFGLFMIGQAYSKQGYHRKANAFSNWYLVGISLLLLGCILFSS
jgi:hypothetical protein